MLPDLRQIIEYRQPTVAVMAAAAIYWTYILESMVFFRMVKFSSADVMAPMELMKTRTAEQVPLLSLWT